MNLNIIQKIKSISRLLFCIFLPFFLLCQKEKIVSNDLSSSRVIHITANLSVEFYAKIANCFESNSTKRGCRKISLVDGSFKPMRDFQREKLTSESNEIFIPLKWTKKSKCQWKYISTSIIIGKKDGASQIERIELYPKMDNKKLIRHLKPDKPINIECKKCSNNNFNPPREYYDCIDLNKNEVDDHIYYCFEDIDKDTIDITVNLSFEE